MITIINFLAAPIQINKLNVVEMFNKHFSEVDLN